MNLANNLNVCTRVSTIERNFLKMKTRREGGICVDRIYYALFSIVLCFSLLSLLTLYKNSHMLISHGNPGMFHPIQLDHRNSNVIKHDYTQQFGMYTIIIA